VDQRRQTSAAGTLIVLVGREPSLADRIRLWPKAELHLHLEGAIEPQTVVELAARHGKEVALEEVADRYRYQDFRGFLEAFKWVTSLLRDPDDYGLIARRAVENLRGQNVVYAEITLSAGVMLRRGQDVAANFDALRSAAENASGGALRVQWIFDATRQFGAEKAMEVARCAAEHRGAGVVAFGLGGDEMAVPAAEFRDAYEFARSHGLHALVHAGEIGGADEVRRAVEVLGAERIGHGIAAVRDPQVMELLGERRIPLEVCPTSNLRTGALGRITGNALSGPSEHPVADLFFAGVPVTLSTDDPAMFETSLVQEYEAAASAGLAIPELIRVNELGFASAFLPEADRQALVARFHEVLRGQGLLY
jgi:aminodeoxyfutalosine deaminase